MQRLRASRHDDALDLLSPLLQRLQFLATILPVIVALPEPRAWRDRAADRGCAAAPLEVSEAKLLCVGCKNRDGTLDMPKGLILGGPGDVHVSRY